MPILVTGRPDAVLEALLRDQASDKVEELPSWSLYFASTNIVRSSCSITKSGSKNFCEPRNGRSHAIGVIVSRLRPVRNKPPNRRIYRLNTVTPPRSTCCHILGQH